MANFSLINEASLVMASGAYKEGKIYSQLPTDGSGDFTFTRGTDTATRVNKDGYIEKERVNFLLQSNQFDTTWVLSNATTVLPNQEGYDGSNDAWLFRLDATNNRVITQSVSVSGVSTFSVYAKKGTIDVIRVRTQGSIDYGREFDLSNGTIGSRLNEAPINSEIEDVGNGWYRCSIVVNASTTTAMIQTSATEIGQYIYIQDAQLEQGLVATDYLETTTVPVYAGLTDNMPRLDYSGGAECGAYLLEESRTNLITYSEDFTSGIWSGRATATNNATTSPEGVTNAALLVDSTLSYTLSYLRVLNTGATTIGATYTLSVYVKPKGNSRVFKFWARNTDAPTTFFDLVDGTTSEPSSSIITPVGNGWFRVSSTGTLLSGTLAAYIYIYTNADNVEGFYVYGLQLEQGSYPSSYIPTYGSTQTRAADVSSVTKAVSSEGSLFINVGGTSQPKLSVLGEYFDASTTANKVAIAYSSTALVISHNGSIVVDKTGTYDVSSLTQIQLGHSNGADQADSPISEFVTFDSFLTNNELNALTQ